MRVIINIVTPHMLGGKTLAPAVIDTKYLLNDEEMRHFIINGYIKVRVEFPPNFHERILQRLKEMAENIRNQENNIPSPISELQQVFSHPIVSGVLISVLGQNYIMHPHRYYHLNVPGSEGQINFHKDAYQGDKKVQHHRSRRIIVFYQPQDVTEEMGPTTILPSTQYYDTRGAACSQTELPLCGKAGTVIIVHHDLWHRAIPNRSDRIRYMLKFTFSRMEEPQSPSWNSKTLEWQPDYQLKDSSKLQVMWKCLWNWICGRQNTVVKDNESPRSDRMPALIKSLQDRDEAVRLNAAYTLGIIGEPAISALSKSLRDRSENTRLHAAYALGAIGSSAVPMLIDALHDVSWGCRASAAKALGDIGRPACEAVPALSQALRDKSNWVRRHAAEALGIIGQPVRETVPALKELLSDENYYVRKNAAYALSQLGSAAEPAVSALIAALNDENRFVRFHAAIALQHIDIPKAKSALFDFFFTTPWITTHLTTLR